MSVRLSCPSCNTGFALDALPADRRATCPRCGDVFPVRGEVAEQANREGAGGPATQPTATPPAPARGGLSPGRAALFAVALGLVGLAVGLVVHYARQPKPEVKPQPDPTPAATATPPAQLAGLGYLPAECNVVFAVQPGPVLDYASRTKKEPRELLTGSGVPQQVFGALDALGLTLPQIDHIAGGLYIPSAGGESLRVALVLVLKQPLADEDEFLAKLKTQPAGAKGRFKVTLDKVPLDALARVSPTVWVFGLTENDLAAVGRGGFGPGGTQFGGSESEGFRKMLAAVPPDAAVWVAADDERDWTQKPLVKLAAGLPAAKNALPALGGGVSAGRGGLAALSFGERPRMRLSARTADTATAERVRAYFQARAAETESATAGGGGTFALYDAPFDPATSGATLRRFLADAAK